MPTLRADDSHARQTVGYFIDLHKPADYEPLLYYAALPMILTPELLHYLRHAFTPKIPWIAEVDILLAESLCRQYSTYEQYLMHADIRAWLLKQARAKPDFRLADAARMLLHYIEDLQRSRPYKSWRDLQAQAWSAMVYIDDEHRRSVVGNIKKALRRAGATQAGGELISEAELERLAHLTEQLAPELEQYPELVEYARYVGNLVRNKTDLDERAYQPFLGEDMPSPAQLTGRQRGTIADIFVSYSRGDGVLARGIAARLSAANYNCWVDTTSVTGGASWLREIQQAIDDCQVVVALVSAASVKSKWVERELLYASQLDKEIIPVLVEDRPLPLSLIDLQPISVVGEDYERGLERLLKYLHRYSTRGVPTDSTMFDIFISYKREEQAVARQLADHLEAQGWSVWWDVQLRGGERFEKVIEDALNISKLVIVLWSPLSVESEFIRNEAGWARDEGKLVPIKIKPTKLPLRFRELHTIDLTEWDGSSSFPAYLDLLTRLTRRVGSTEVPRPSEAADLLAELEDLATTHQRRAEIGNQLAEIGDPRPGVGVDDRGVPSIEWCEVPGGEITLERNGSTFKTQTFYIARYPVTKVQFRAFLKAEDGYKSKSWWKDLKRDELETQDESSDNHPATKVSWYDAVAFSRWLSKRLGHEVMLPTEAQWQQAATGGESKREYPWGTDWDAALANTIESNIHGTTAVGAYPGGASPVGALDMAGNVWEWCLNKYDDPGDSTIDTSDHCRVLRGGSWFNVEDLARCAYGLNPRQFARSLDYGFRMSCSSPIFEH